MLAYSKVAWTVETRGLFLTFSAFYGNVEIIAPECTAGPVPFYSKFFFVMFMPIAAAHVSSRSIVLISKVSACHISSWLPAVDGEKLQPTLQPTRSLHWRVASIDQRFSFTRLCNHPHTNGDEVQTGYEHD